MRVLFLYPKSEKPAGGLGQVRLLAKQIADCGVDAQLLLEDPAFDDSSMYNVCVPVANYALADARAYLNEKDVLVLPEFRLDRWLSFCRDWPCRLAVNNQNGFLALDSRVWGLSSRFRVEFLIANSNAVAEISHHYLGIERNRVFLLNHFVVREPFVPELPFTLSGEKAIAFMPRKCAEDIRKIRATVERIRPDIKWLEIDRVPPVEVARRLRACQVFLSTQDREGCPLPSLEAMSCGCIVAGYPGTPGFPHPYSHSGNGFWARDRDVEDAAKQLLRAFDVIEKKPSVVDATMDAAYLTLQAFTKNAFEASVNELLQAIRTQRYARRNAYRFRLPLRSKLSVYRHLRSIGRLGFRDRLVALFSR